MLGLAAEDLVGKFSSVTLVDSGEALKQSQRGLG